MLNDRPKLGRKPAVLVVDVTRWQADPTSPEHVPTIVTASAEIRKLLDVARQSGIPVFFSRGGRFYHTHAQAPLTNLERGAWIWKNPLRQGDESEVSLAMELPPIFKRSPEEVLISKSCPSAFFGTMLAIYLLQLQVDTLIICGVHTSACVRATVTDAFSYGFRVLIPEECVADRRADAHLYNLREMHEKYAEVLPLEDVTGYLRKAGEAAI